MSVAALLDTCDFWFALAWSATDTIAMWQVNRGYFPFERGGVSITCSWNDTLGLKAFCPLKCRKCHWCWVSRDYLWLLETQCNSCACFEPVYNINVGLGNAGRLRDKWKAIRSTNSRRDLRNVKLVVIKSYDIVQCTVSISECCNYGIGSWKLKPAAREQNQRISRFCAFWSGPKWIGASCSDWSGDRCVAQPELPLARPADA